MYGKLPYKNSIRDKQGFASPMCKVRLREKGSVTLYTPLDTLHEQLLAHEAEYFTFGAQWTQTPCAWYLDSASLPDYRDCNHALRLRDDGRGPEAVAREVIAHYLMRGLPVAADIDIEAEHQGIGAALRRLGVTPILGHRLLMRYDPPTAPQPPERGITVEQVPNDLDTAETRVWVEMAVSDEEEPADRARWRLITEHEARSPACRLYLARIDGRPAGTCDLFVAGGWGRIDSVVTHPELRRRGVASALVAHAVRESLATGNQVTYLFTDAGGAGEQVYLRLGFTVWATDILRRHIRF
jgi:GNAT superfamily N-acetyltransferase